MTYFAHAGEVHETTTANASHWLSEWFVSIPLFLLGLFIVCYAAYHLFKRSLSAALNVAMAGLLLSGVLSYSALPALSIFAIASGFALSLLTVFGALAKK